MPAALTRGSLHGQNLHLRGRPHQLPVTKCLTTLLLTVFTQSNFVADFLEMLSENRKISSHCVFRPPLGWGLEAGYDVHLTLIGKGVVDFLLVIIELFSL